ncbi:MAG: methionine--tRNA ligase [Candidatus Pacearchaeota archaeon]
MSSRKKFYITTPIYYTNDVPHIGHSYTTIIADILARYHRLLGEDVFFLTGTDEHGIKIQRIAEKKNKKPKQFVDEIVNEFKKAWKTLNIEYDNFIRTTDEKHIKIVQDILQKLYDKKMIYKGKYEAYYCTGCEQYKTSSELVNGTCPLHNTTVEVRSEEAYLFKLSKFQKELRKLIENNEYKILPIQRKNEMLSFLIREDLQDISISRPKSEVYWGIELPFDKNHTCYVWIDAFLNYISGLNYPSEQFRKYWPADIQLMSKDILRVHSTIWPSILLSINEKLPKMLYIHGYFTVNGQKMSKSLGNAIDPIKLSEKYGSDAVRYFLMRHIPLGEDGDFSEDALKERYNSELANKLGNLVLRVAGMAKGKIPKSSIDADLASNLKLTEIYSHMDNVALDKALEKIFGFIDKCNEYIQEKQPWKLEGKEKEKVLYNLIDSIRIISILLYPFMPETSKKINKQFNFPKPSIENAVFGKTKEGKIKKLGVLFEKL